MEQIGATGPPANYQTVKLLRGRHSSPDDGVCVMELASMLAEEPFSDHPQSVCPVIGGFLRAYNDRLDDHWRQDLYAYAAKAVGTRSTIEVERRRAQMCREWLRHMSGETSVPEDLPGPPSQPGRLRGWLQGFGREAAARRAALAFGRRELNGQDHKLDYELHRATLCFVDQLIATGAREDPLVTELAATAIEGPPAVRG